jgi:hypothetical protein
VTRHAYDLSGLRFKARDAALVELVLEHGPGALVEVKLTKAAAKWADHPEFSGTLLEIRDDAPTVHRFRVWCPMWKRLLDAQADEVAHVLVTRSGDRDQRDRLIAALATLAREAGRRYERVRYSARRLNSDVTDGAVEHMRAAKQRAEDELREALDASQEDTTHGNTSEHRHPEP